MPTYPVVRIDFQKQATIRDDGGIAWRQRNNQVIFTLILLHMLILIHMLVLILVLIRMLISYACSY